MSQGENQQRRAAPSCQRPLRDVDVKHEPETAEDHRTRFERSNQRTGFGRGERQGGQRHRRSAPEYSGKTLGPHHISDRREQADEKASQQKPLLSMAIKPHR